MPTLRDKIIQEIVLLVEAEAPYKPSAEYPPTSLLPKSINTDQSFIYAGNEGYCIRMFDKAGRVRIAEPYMIYITSRGKRCYHINQLSGYSASNVPAGFKNPQTNSMKKIEVLKDSPILVNDAKYNPSNRQMFRQIIYAVPKVRKVRRVPPTKPAPTYWPVPARKPAAKPPQYWQIPTAFTKPKVKPKPRKPKAPTPVASKRPTGKPKLPTPAVGRPRRKPTGFVGLPRRRPVPVAGGMRVRR